MPETSPLYTRLSASTARKLLHYDARTGELTWNVDRRRVKMGDRAGTVRKDGRLSVVINGEAWLANRLIWLMQTGEEPTERLVFRDDDPKNLRWSNIMPERDILSGSKLAVYQRDLRRRRRALLDTGALRDK